MPLSYNKKKSKNKSKKRQTRKQRMQGNRQVQKGGTRQVQKGGNKGWGYGVPVGAPLEQAYVSTWGKSNYYPLSPTGIPVGGNDPAIPSNPQFSFSGGAKKQGTKKQGTKKRGTKRNYKKQRGGGLFADVTHAYRSVTNGVGRAFDTYNGNLSPANSYPSPTTQHLLNDTNNSDYLLSVPYKLPNISEIHYNAGRYVGMMGGGQILRHKRKRGKKQLQIGGYSLGDVITILNANREKFPAIFLGNLPGSNMYAVYVPNYLRGEGRYSYKEEHEIMPFEGSEEEKKTALTLFKNRPN